MDFLKIFLTKQLKLQWTAFKLHFYLKYPLSNKYQTNFYIFNLFLHFIFYFIAISTVLH